MGDLLNHEHQTLNNIPNVHQGQKGIFYTKY